MLLESEKIYRTQLDTINLVLPTIEVIGAVSFYVSNSVAEPASVAEMTDVSSEIHEGINTLVGQARYVAAVFGEGASVSECGVLSTINTTTRG
jgi:hypothetical protein